MDAFIAAERARNKQAELSAIRSGIIAAPEPEREGPERITVAGALEDTANTSAITGPCALSEPIGRF